MCIRDSPVLDSDTRAAYALATSSLNESVRLPTWTWPPAKRTRSPPTRYFAEACATRRLRNVLAAACAALPFKSAPDDAAVADVFGTLLVSVVAVRVGVSGGPNSVARTCA